MTTLADKRRLGILPLQDHDPKRDPDLRNVVYCVRILGLDDQKRPIPDERTAGDLAGAVVIRPDGEDRASSAVWSHAMPVVGQQTLGAPVIQTSANGTVSGKPNELYLTAARGPDKDGNLQPEPGLEQLRYGRDGNDNAVYNLAGNRKLPAGAGGLLVAALDPTRQVPLLADLGPLIAVNQGGDDEAGSPVYDLKVDGTIDEDRYARLQSFWRVKDVVPASKAGFATVDPDHLHDTAGKGSLCWQLTGGGTSSPPLHGGGLVYDDSAIDEPAFTASQAAQATDAQRRLDEAVAAAQAAGGTVVRGIDGSVLVTDGGFFVRTTANLYRNNIFNSAGTYHDQTQVRPPSDPSNTEVRDPPKPRATHAVALVSARRGGPVDVGGDGCEHVIAGTTDGEPVRAAHLRTGTLYRSPRGREGPLEITDVAYDRPGPQPFKTQVHIRYDKDETYDWILGTGHGMYRLQGETLLSPPPATIVERIFPPEDPPPSPPPPPSDPGPDPIGDWFPGGQPVDDTSDQPAWNSSNKFGTFDPRPQSISTPGGVLAGNPGPTAAIRSNSRTPSVGPIVRPPMVSDTTRTPTGTGWMAGKLYSPGICFVAPEQRGTMRTATGQGTFARPEVANLLVTAPNGVSGATLVPDPCKKNQPVATGGIALVPPCYSHDDLYNAKASPTGSPLQVYLPPGVSQLALGTPTQVGGIKNGVTVGGDGTALVVTGKNASGVDVHAVALDGHRGALRVPTLSGTPITPTVGTGVFYNNGKVPYFVDDTGTVTSLGVAGGGVPTSRVITAGTGLTGGGDLTVDRTIAIGDAELLAIAGLTSAADKVPYFTGSGTAALATLTSAARDLLDDATAADMRTTLGIAATSDGYYSSNASNGFSGDWGVLLSFGGSGAASVRTVQFREAGASFDGSSWAAFMQHGAIPPLGTSFPRLARANGYWSAQLRPTFTEVGPSGIRVRYRLNNVHAGDVWTFTLWLNDPNNTTGPINGDNPIASTAVTGIAASTGWATITIPQASLTGLLTAGMVPVVYYTLDQTAGTSGHTGPDLDLAGIELDATG